MSPCVPIEGGWVCLSDATVLLHTAFEETPRWCFNCRRHVRYNLELHGSREPSYYGPTWSGHCPNCGQDGASGGFYYFSWNWDE